MATTSIYNSVDIKNKRLAADFVDALDKAKEIAKAKPRTDSPPFHETSRELKGDDIRRFLGDIQ